mmetsp:Transcript_25597/g.75523  ORF Transcript_25597/g.75523 Transcript_25597/m.75523 type:complete len:214 (-) Transcript_25597:2717-3358(-)
MLRWFDLFDEGSRLHGGHVGHDNFHSLGLSRTRLARYQDGLVMAIHGETTICQGRCFVYMRVKASLAISISSSIPYELVHVKLPRFIPVQTFYPLKRIDGNDNVSDPRVRFFLRVPRPQVIQNRSLVQAGEVAHVGQFHQVPAIIDILQRQGAAVVLVQVDVPIDLFPRRHEHGYLGHFPLVREDVGGEPSVLLVAHVNAGGGGGLARHFRRG